MRGRHLPTVSFTRTIFCLREEIFRNILCYRQGFLNSCKEFRVLCHLSTYKKILSNGHLIIFILRTKIPHKKLLKISKLKTNIFINFTRFDLVKFIFINTEKLLLREGAI